MITLLTPEQESLIPVYREKWKQIAYSTERIDRKKVNEVVKAAYNWIEQEEPEILFFDSPYAAFKELNVLDWPFDELPNQDLLSQLRHPFTQETRNILCDSQHIQLQKELEEDLWNRLWQERQPFYSQMEEQLDAEDMSIPTEWEYGTVQTDLLHPECTYYDFYISVLNFAHKSSQWQILQDIVKNCGWVLTYQDACLVCDRPIKFSFDNAKQLDAEAEPAIEFADGFKVFAHHGEYLLQT